MRTDNVCHLWWWAPSITIWQRIYSFCHLILYAWKFVCLMCALRHHSSPKAAKVVFRARAGRAHSTASLPNNRHQISIQIPSISYLCHLHFAITNDEKALDKVMLLPNERLTLLNVFNANTLQLIRKVFVQKLWKHLKILRFV